MSYSQDHQSDSVWQKYPATILQVIKGMMGAGCMHLLEPFFFFFSFQRNCHGSKLAIHLLSALNRWLPKVDFDKLLSWLSSYRAPPSKFLSSPPLLSYSENSTACRKSYVKPQPGSLLPRGREDQWYSMESHKVHVFLLFSYREAGWSSRHLGDSYSRTNSWTTYKKCL